MKKILLTIFSFVLILGLTACSSVKKDIVSDSSIKEVAIQDSVKTEGFVKEEDSKSLKDDKKEVEEKNDNDDEKVAEEKMEEEDGELLISNPQKILLILDASGSMWGQIDGKAKIDIAKDVVKKTVKNFEDVELGLMAYGHRRKGDCKDIEILSKPEKNNSENISKVVDGISPKGMTPMGNSVLMAAESLRYSEQKATVILVSDGIETCDVDLCELGKKLEETGVDFTAHVIGFDMTESQTIGLRCLADETGGKFISAKDADSLSDALGEVVEASSCSKEKLGESVISNPSEVEVNKEFDITWTGPNNENDIIVLLPKGDDDSNNDLDYISALNSKNWKAKLKTPKEVGEYDVVYFANCGAILGRSSLKTIGTVASLVVTETASVGSEMLIKWEGPNNSDDYIGIFLKGATNWNNHFETFTDLANKNGSYKLNVPVDTGEYDVVYWLGQEKVLIRKPFLVVEATANFIDVPGVVKKDSDFSITWDGPNNKKDAITIVPKGSINWNDHVGDSLYSLYGKDGKGVLKTPDVAGEYDVVYWLDQKKILARKTFNITN